MRKAFWIASILVFLVNFAVADTYTIYGKVEIIGAPNTITISVEKDKTGPPICPTKTYKTGEWYSFELPVGTYWLEVKHGNRSGYKRFNMFKKSGESRLIDIKVSSQDNIWKIFFNNQQSIVEGASQVPTN